MMTLSQCRAELALLRARQGMQNLKHITFIGEEAIIYAGNKNKIYRPNPTAKLFHDDRSFVKLIMGPYGSGKSTTCINDIVRHASEMPVWSNGRRKSKWLIVRNTSGELHSTTLQTWLQWFGDLGDIKKRQKPLLTYEHVYNDGDGIVELDLVFLALDRPDDVRKVKSLEATGCYINELSEVPQAALSHLKGRVNNRYPSPSFCPDYYWSGIIADTNPPDEDHWIYKDFEQNISPNYKVFYQPTGLVEENGEFIKDKEGNYVQNVDCDNNEHLAKDYYVKLAEKQSQGFIKVFCGGKYGVVESGKRVYPEYSDLHSVGTLDAIQGLPIHLGWDFGLTPACLVIQITPRGHVHVLKEYVAEDLGIRTFAKNIVLPSLVIDFPYNRIGESEGDPAGAAGDQIMEELSCIGELNSLGIKTNAATTNDIDVRISSVRYFLNALVDGKPTFLLSRAGAPITHKGFVNGYHFKRMQIGSDERYQEKPNKNRFSHPHDALQYILMKFASDRVIETKKPETKVDMWNPVMRWDN